ncbi:PREDICTED: uncharacterized protein LOC104708649 [Camelina sativa]|uniref:Uncharacterized protein LOC104708649 n=1 Tax=Camelina sativa TaxID=90675 RepID=A0ABM0TB34_CAMSA|nr:PREDICTED: uncharacterized protein LOC104708649 [Camelina sativa]
MASSSQGAVPGSSQGEAVPDSLEEKMRVKLAEICEHLSLSQRISEEDLQRVKSDLLVLQEDKNTAWIDAFETPSCTCRQLEIVKRLLLHEMTSHGQLVNDLYRQSLALDIAAGNGDLETVKNLCELNLHLLDKNNSDSHGLEIPVLRASNAGHGKVTDYLYFNYRYHRKLIDILKGNEEMAACLLLDAIFYGFLDIALDMLITEQLPSSLAVTKKASQRSTPLELLALKPDLFRSHCNLGFWRRRIYSCIELDSPAESEEASKPNRCQRIFWKIIQRLPKRFGIDQTSDLKDRHSKADNLLQRMCKATRAMVKDESWKETVYESLLAAVENGNKEFFIEIIKCNPPLLWISKAASGRNLFQLAVEFKKEKIFNLIHGLDDRKVTLLRSSDNKNNNILHIAAHLSTPDQLSKISGAALKMQRESQWFEEVKSMVSEREVVQRNNDNKTPREIFEDSHEPLRKEGEEWMKYTATACSFVAALIATVTFQAIFTVPGGTNETSGAPLLLTDKHFTAFIFADTLAFFASCISVLIFLSILTSRYSFDDFIVSLPRKMILGQSILFISIASMLVAFITSLSASMRERPLLVVPFKPLASVPAFLFLMLQYPLLNEMISSTYGKRLFHRDTKSWLVPCVDITITHGSSGPISASSSGRLNI